jgi:ribosomal protein S27AE
VTHRPDADHKTDDRPPICPACGVTMGMEITDGKVRYVCLECGFSDREVAAD